MTAIPSDFRRTGGELFMSCLSCQVTAMPICREEKKTIVPLFDCEIYLEFLSRLCCLAGVNQISERSHVKPMPIVAGRQKRIDKVGLVF